MVEQPKQTGDTATSIPTSESIQIEHLSHKIPHTTLEAAGHPMRLVKGVVAAIVHATQSNSESEAVIIYLHFMQIISRSKHNRILLNLAGFVPPFLSYLRYQSARIQELLEDPVLKDSKWHEYIYILLYFISFSFPCLLFIYLYRSLNDVLKKFQLCLSITRSFNGVTVDWLDIPLIAETSDDTTTIKEFLVSTLSISNEKSEVGCPQLAINCVNELLSCSYIVYYYYYYFLYFFLFLLSFFFLFIIIYL